MKLFIFSVISYFVSFPANAATSLLPLKYAKNVEIYINEDAKLVKIKKHPEQCIQVGGNRMQITCRKVLYFAKPINNVVIGSSTFYAYLKDLGMDSHIKALSQGAYVPHLKIKSLNLPQDVAELNELNVDSILTFSYGDLFFNKNVSISKINIPVLFLNEFEEEHPLARAEWIKIFGILFGKYSTAEQVFDKIETEYWKTVKEIKSSYKNKAPAIVYSDLNKEKVYLIKDDGFFAKLFNDCEIDLRNTSKYFGVDPRLNSFKMEYAYTKIKDVDFWLLPFGSSVHNKAPNFFYKQINAWKNDSIYSIGQGPGLGFLTDISLHPEYFLRDIKQMLLGKKSEMRYLKNEKI